MTVCKEVNVELIDLCKNNSFNKRKKNSKNKIGKQLKVLSLATLLSFYCPTVANAVGISKNLEDLTKTTLDELCNGNIDTPDGLMSLRPSSYILKEVSEPQTPTPNIITKYILDSTTKKIIPHYFEVILKDRNSGPYTDTITIHTDNPDKNSENYNSTIFEDIRVEKTNESFTQEEIDNQESGVFGGALTNVGDTGLRDSIFKNNESKITVNESADNYDVYASSGGAIYNWGNIGHIDNTDFINNSAVVDVFSSESDGFAAGGAIFNSGSIESIAGNFSHNYASSYNGNAFGGAIFNTQYSKIGDIASIFIENMAMSENGNALGGAIYNYNSNTNNIVGDFIGNFTDTTEGNSAGGAIYNNESMINNIVGDFVGNFTDTTEGNSAGGAIYNYDSNMNDIVGDFVGNYATTQNGNANGGAIYSSNGKIDTIAGDFTGNYASSNNTSLGGAIYNYDSSSKIGNIKGNFTKNSAIATSADNSTIAAGGAIYGSYDGTITANFIENIAAATSKTSTATAQGGAINICMQNDSYSDSIEGNFENNSASAIAKTNTAIAQGGAVYHKIKVYSYNTNFQINNSDFNNNKVEAISETGAANAEGGAIYKNNETNYNYDRGDYIKGNFTNNTADATSTSGSAIASGGAIYSEKEYGSYHNATANIFGNFINNKISATSETGKALARGGAIMHTNQTNSIEGNFEGNEALANSKSKNAISQGGALYTNWNNNNGYKGVIDNIKGNFTKNSAIATSTDGSSIATGGAIYGSYDGTITNIAANFIENQVVATSKSADINESAQAFGGAISTMKDVNDWMKYSGEIGNITGDFTNNSAIANSKAGTAEAKGGAIYHQRGEYNDDYKPMSIFDANFTNNKAEAKSETGNTIAQGGAIYNEGEIINLIAKNNNIVFLNNTANGASNAVHMGTNTYYITKLNLNTENGKSIIFNDSITSSNAGGIESKQININGDISNESSLGYYEATEGTIILNADMGGYTGEVNLYGGTLKIAENGTFFGNDTNLVNFNFEAGKLDLENGKIDNIILNDYASVDGTTIVFDANLDTGESDNFKTSAVDNTSKLKFSSINVLENGLTNVLTLFNGNSPTLEGNTTTITKKMKYTFTPGATAGTIDVASVEGSYSLYDAVKDSSKNRTYSMDEAEIVNKDLADMLGGNDAELTIAGNGNGIKGEGRQGVVVHEAQTLNVQKVGSVDDTGNVINSWQNHNSENGGAISNSGNLKITSAIFSENKANETGGAIKNDGEATIQNSAFIKNNSKNSGGAIYNEGSLNLTDASFIENSVDSDTRAIKTGGAIQNTGGDIVISATSFDVNFIGNTVNGVRNDIHTENILNPDGSVGSSGTVTFAGTKNTNITGGISGNGNVIKEGTGSLNLDGNNENFTGDFALNEGSVNLAKNATYFSAANTSLSNNTTFNMVNNQTGSVNFGNLNVDGKANIGLDVDLANSRGDYISTNSIDPTSSGTLNINNIFLISDTTKKEAFIDVIDTSNGLSQLGELDSSASSALGPIYKYGISYDKNTGQLYFNSMGNAGGNNFSAYNPAILTGPVAQQAAYLGMVENYINAFANMDMVMLMPKKDRDAMLYKNRYAAADGSLAFTPSMIPEEDKGLWFRPYSTFEKVNLNNGPDVSNIMYGSLFGGDSPLVQTKWGFSKVFSAYAGYTGSHQTFNGQGIYQNGGLLGATTAFYKGNFYTGLTANVGAIQAQASTNYGQDNFTMLTAGVASKSGYNFGFFNEKLIVQPNFMMSYSFINTFDYTTSSNINISQEPLNAIQIVPGIKFIGNLKNNWQPYLAVSMVWNIMDKTRFKANDVSLPDLSVDPYVLYGIGVQKHWGERFTGFAQSMFRSGGRNGVGLQVGFRWSI